MLPEPGGCEIRSRQNKYPWKRKICEVSQTDQMHTSPGRGEASMALGSVGIQEGKA